MIKHVKQEIDYRLSKWLIWNASMEQLLTPDEVENMFRELLSFYDPPTRCVERVQSMFARNARVAQNQDDYSAAYDSAVNRYEATKAEREQVVAEIRQRGIRRREFERFIDELKKLPEAVSEFDEALWGSLVEYVTVSKDKTMVFTLLGGTEMKA